MVMRITNTSVISLAEEQSKGNVNYQWNRILTFLKINGPKTRGQLAKLLNMEKSTVSARVNLLKNKRLVKDEKKVVCPVSKKTVYLVEVVNKCSNCKTCDCGAR